MNAVPEYTAEEALRFLLDTVHDVLDVPWDVCPSSDARDGLVARRAIAVRVALDSLGRYQRDPAKAANWLRKHVAENMPIPAKEATNG